MRTTRALVTATAMLLAACATIAPASPRGQGIPWATAGPAVLPSAPATATKGRVVHVTDGDTIVLRGIAIGEVHAATGGRKARLIGVDTPEVVGNTACYGREASAFTKRELEGTDVLVAYDVGRVDRYGRALVYVWDVEGRFFNARLVREGYALQLTVVPNVRYAQLFTDLVREARTASRGLWAGC